MYSNGDAAIAWANLIRGVELLDSMAKLHQNPPEPAEKVGKFYLSIQTRPGSYCSEDSVEIALFEEDGDTWIKPRTDPRFENFEWASRFQKEYEGVTTSVAGYFPKSLLRQVRKDLESLS